MISWTTPLPEIPTEEEGIEVNLGNHIRSGEIQPLIPEPPAAAEEEVNTPPKTQQAEPEEAKEVETNNNDKEAPDVSLPKPVKPAPDNSQYPEKRKYHTCKESES